MRVIDLSYQKPQSQPKHDLQQKPVSFEKGQCHDCGKETLVKYYGKESKSSLNLYLCRKCITKRENTGLIPSGMKLGQAAKHLIKKGYSNKKIVGIILTLFPSAKTTSACIAWYRNDMKKKGEL